MSSSSSHSPIESNPIASGSVVTSFTKHDLETLREIERALKSKGSLIHQQHESPQSPLSPPILAQSIEQYVSRIDELKNLIMSGEGNEEEWRNVVDADSGAIYQVLVLILAYLPLSPDSYHLLIQTLYPLGTLNPSLLYSTIVSYPASLDKLLASLFAELERDELLARLRLLDLILLASYHQTPPQLTNALDEQIQELLMCLTSQSESVFSLTVACLLLLNSIDPKRTLHRILMSTLESLSTSTEDSSSSTPTQLTTGTFSRFSIELVTLLNLGRIPSTYVESEEQIERHSGVDPTRRTSVEDIYQSHRVVPRGAVERDPNCAPLTSATLNFLSQLFRTNTVQSVMYTNELNVLIEVLIRRLEDERHESHLTLDFLMCLDSIVSWSEYRDHTYKRNELIQMLNTLKQNYRITHELSEEEQEELSEKDRDDYESTLAINQLIEMVSTKLATL